MMRISDLISTSSRAVRSNPLRSALTSLGVIIGVMSVVILVALGSGATASVQQSIASLGSNLIIVVPGSQRGFGGARGAAGGGNTLTLGDAEAIKSQVEGVVVVAPGVRSYQQVIASGLNWNTQIMGVTPDYLIARDWNVENGRFFDESENRQGRKVAVIGATVAANLFPNMDPIGQSVRIHGGSYSVIGVMESKGQSGMGGDQDDVVLAPLLTVKRTMSGRQGRADTVNQISVKGADADTVAQTTEDITTLLRQRHHTQEGEDDFTAQNLTSITETIQSTVGTLTLLVSGIAGISLLVGGIGIMNIMLVSVTERTREIGLRKALGARRSDILSQFGLEAVALSAAGGLLGLILGSLAAWGLTSLFKMPLVLSPGTALIAMSFSAGVGVIFGAYPAWRAARLDPIEALRRE